MFLVLQAGDDGQKGRRLGALLLPRASPAALLLRLRCFAALLACRFAGLLILLPLLLLHSHRGPSGIHRRPG